MKQSLCGFLYRIALAVCFPGLLLAQTSSAPTDFRVTLLGTGTPRPDIDRFGPSTLVQVGDQRLLFDAGRGATIRLNQVGVPLGDITAVFLTHLHSDHVNGLSDVWLTGWSFGQRVSAFRVFGPTGTREMMSHLEQAHREDIRIRIADERLPASGVAVDAADVTEGIVYEHDGVRVTAFDVDHGELIKPALGYRVEFGGRSVVLSGDTRFSANLVTHAKGADVIIHEVMAASESFLAQSEARQRVMAHHTNPEDAARVFAEVGPRLAVYSHIVLASVSEDDLIRRTKSTYSGRFEVGSDLMTIDVNEVVRITRPDEASR